MNTEMSRIDRSKLPEDDSPAKGDAPQAVNDTERPPDPPPVPAAGSDETGAKRPRGFAAMNKELVIAIARKGGKAAHSAGTAHEFTSDEARVAGRKGGRATHARRREATEKVRDEPHAADEKPRGQPR
jgi:general stress protein YciG